MAQFSYNDYVEKTKNKLTTSTKKGEWKVGFFKSLKDDEDFAIVRFAYKTPDEFEFATVHSVPVKTKDGKEYWKRVSCLRNPKEPLDKCPFCNSLDPNTSKVFSKLYVKLVEYTKDENGQIVGKAVVWERPAKFADKLKALFDNYGDLSQSLFKVVRHGVKGSMQVDYDILLAPTTIYKNEVYTAEALSNFDGYKIEGHHYLMKTLDDMNSYLLNGEFPTVNTETEPTEHSETPFVAPFNKVGEPDTVVNKEVAVLRPENDQSIKLEPSEGPVVRAIPTNSTEEDPTVNRPRRYNTY